MSPGIPSQPMARLAVHSLSWLLIGNGVGMLLATLLWVPSLGDHLAPLTYGRWMPVHLEVQLYGWCSLPLVGLLWRLYGLDRSPAARCSLWLWSTSLAVGALSWLFGAVSGKLFLSWTGWPRLFFIATLVALACLLAQCYGRSLAERWRRGACASQGFPVLVGKGLLLLVLMAIPWILFQASQPSVYPPINPDSGGATGGSLLGSTLGIVLLLILYPHLLGDSAPRPETGKRSTRFCLAVWGLHFGVFALLDHGDHSHHEPWQIAGLLSLVIWLPLLIHHLRRFSWSPTQRRWLVALAAWGALLLLSGGVSFLPGVLERWKFTHALVAHAHVAMAGLVTSWNVSILGGLLPDGALQRIFGASVPFLLWHGGCLLMIVTLMSIGVAEGHGVGYLWRGSVSLDVLLAIRWLAGASMVVAAWRWWQAARRVVASAVTTVTVTRNTLQTVGGN